MIRGEKVCLRPLRHSDLDILHEHANDIEFESPYNNFGLKRDRHLAAAFEEDGLLNSQFGNLVVTTSDDQFIGTVSYHPAYYGPESSIAYNIGVSLAPEQRGKGYGVEAQKLLANYLFQTYPVMRIEATTDITNIPEQRALVKAGFTREGVLRKAQWRGGDWHDVVLYSKLRGE